MENTAKIVQLRPQKIRPPRSTGNLKKGPDVVKYYTKQQIQLLRRTVRDAASIALSKGNSTEMISLHFGSKEVLSFIDDKKMDLKKLSGHVNLRE
jgi:hypothetical protein